MLIASEASRSSNLFNRSNRRGFCCRGKVAFWLHDLRQRHGLVEIGERSHYPQRLGDTPKMLRSSFHLLGRRLGLASSLYIDKSVLHLDVGIREARW
jgi:hypothetical protein